MTKQKEIKDKILALTKEYSELVHKDNLVVETLIKENGKLYEYSICW